MARIRYLKPEFFFDEDLAALKCEVRLGYAGLWCHADRQGRLEDSPKRLKAMIFPYDNVDMEKIISALTVKPFIQRYEVKGKRYIQIINWAKHQKPHHTEKDSLIPESPTPPMGKGMEKGSMHVGSAELSNVHLTVKHTLSSKFIPPTHKEIKDYCLERKNFINVDKFINHYESNGWKVGRNKMQNWKAAVRTWEQSQNKGAINDNSIPEDLQPYIKQPKF